MIFFLSLPTRLEGFLLIDLADFFPRFFNIFESFSLSYQ